MNSLFGGFGNMFMNMARNQMAPKAAATTQAAASQPQMPNILLQAMGAALRGEDPHRFRRTLATNLISRGMPIQEVAKILGHEKLDTTMKYVYLDNDDLKFSYNKFNT